MLVLGIETSCDETSAAVVEDGTRLRSNVVSSQVDVHARYGGVVPELASREHIRNMIPVLEEALHTAGVVPGDLDLVAVTLGPGLIGSLLAGVETAKMLAWANRKPLVPVHHIAAHVHSAMLAPRLGPDGGALEQSPPLCPPYLSLVVSGGHTSLILAHEPGRYQTLGQTLDDAAGEAFDKVARLLRLGYPGGPVIDRLAREGDPAAVTFPVPYARSNDLNFSFSGLKTAVLRYVETVGLDVIVSDRRHLCNVAAGFQHAVIEALLEKADAALCTHRLNKLAVVGGVAANGALRAALARRFPHCDVRVPPLSLCTDNAGMIAALGYHLRDRATREFLSLNADANLALE
ncbi:MAG: tRNA (adenosine(37)-N6)-threonylcarbamoyltransferase complex transferase subunit TsaD [Candidatus Sumerlaeia bacterium]